MGGDQTQTREPFIQKWREAVVLFVCVWEDIRIVLLLLGILMPAPEAGHTEKWN